MTDIVSSEVLFGDLYESLDDVQSGAMWQFVGQKIKSKVKRLMNKGVDVNGTTYKRYTGAYTRWRVKNGLKRKVNLQLTSKMWKSIQARHTVDYFEVYITGAKENLKAEWNIKERDFFSWGTETYKELDRAIDIYLRKVGF